MGRSRDQRDRSRRRGEALFQPHDVPLSLGGGVARGEHVRLYRRRHLRPVQAASGVERLRAYRLRRIRHSQRELRDQAGHQSGGAHSAQHRELPAPAPAHGRDVRLAARVVDHRPTLLQVDPVDLRAAVQGWEGVQESRPGQLVPELQDRARQRAGDQWGLRALRHPGRATHARAVVLPHHRICRPPLGPSG